jgi:hypothetical protein
MLFFVTYLKGKIPGKIKRLKLADLIKLWPRDMQRNVIPLLSHLCMSARGHCSSVVSMCLSVFQRE